MTSEPRAIPFERSYWVSPGRLLAGHYPGAINRDKATENLKALMRAGIRTCLDLTEENEINIAGQPLIAYELEWKQLTGDSDSYRRRPVRDRDVPSPYEMKAILDLIDSEISRSRPVYLHCLGGVGRTGTVVGCWLARHNIAAGSQVLDYIRDLRKHEPYGSMNSPQTAGQREMVRNWQAGE